ncbi:Lrp/AsnC family transcriptional regulator [Aquisalinus flavus]|uniref:ArsR family transcriptional regulator n=1 Tax=Aquisalinus flavus TaxID=1526572 RepID=A0A8J2V1N9_9PROT|nr:Lrp/AsnC family transcriptional regulator [Aquisalinus flavus]MBD0427602.1 Lrp/AsnC family transcriptional regulator [Aquisalinus flavus]UNE47392.1 Lrp/AsnC family transcriptional regulator [Aquisalinus flavus]GGD02288.1 ArsR family transcriptional regulator [Aquisalinus flavus]
MKLDQIDRKILHYLQENARITNADLAEKVGLSPTPCLRRLRRLETEGIIKGYRTEINREALGVGVTVVILVKLEKEDETSLRSFEAEISQRPEVMECYLVTGKFDYFMRVIIPTLTAYETFLSETLLRMSNVASVESSFTLREVTKKAVVPLPKN